MNRSFWCVVAATLSAAATIGGASPAAAATSCDRQCLTQLLDRYMAAVFAHDPKAAPLALVNRATLNGRQVAPGEGFWRIVQGYGPVQRRFLDPESDGAVYFGELRDGPVLAVASVRIKVAGRKITEAEWIVGTSETSHEFEQAGLQHYPPPLTIPLPAAERTPRAQLIATANAYFEGLNNHDGSAVPEVVGCDRIENGGKMTHRERKPPAGSTTAPNPRESGDCTAGFEGFKNSIVNLQPRRFLIVDDEDGVVLGSTILHRPPGVTEKRNLVMEFFFVRGGKIASIYAAMADLAPDAPDSPGW